MINMEFVLWLFPVLFMVHDFEEILLLEAWIQKNRIYLETYLPDKARCLLSHFGKISAASFALGVAEEFALLVIVTMYASLSHWYLLWLGLFIAFTLHLGIHCVQAVILKKYVPALATSLLCLPVCVCIIVFAVQLFPAEEVLGYTFFGLLLVGLNLIFMHKKMVAFEQWLQTYRTSSRQK